ncbi:hypothetical protein [Nostoc sp.]|uniref:hypothetical protein n=1 Tax=Nostoc sp. TaxID=1180 RepID=UPI002FF46D69
MFPELISINIVEAIAHEKWNIWAALKDISQQVDPASATITVSAVEVTELVRFVD